MSKISVSDVVVKLVGKYSAEAIAIYCCLVAGIEASDSGEFHFTLNRLIEQLTYYAGKRPVKLHKSKVFRWVDKFWEDGLLDFCPTANSNVARLPSGDKEWKTVRDVK